jgi:hypothetical protein
MQKAVGMLQANVPEPGQAYVAIHITLQEEGATMVSGDFGLN